MYSSIQQHLAKELETIRESGFYKSERIIVSPQDAHIRVGDGQSAIVHQHYRAGRTQLLLERSDLSFFLFSRAHIPLAPSLLQGGLKIRRVELNPGTHGGRD